MRMWKRAYEGATVDGCSVYMAVLSSQREAKETDSKIYEKTTYVLFRLSIFKQFNKKYA